MTEKNQYRLQTLLPAVSVGLLTMAFILAKTGRDALFFQGKGLLQMPTAAAWLWLTRNLRTDLAGESSAAPAVAPVREGEIDCVRFPEQCPCTTEWGKGIR